MAAEGGGQSVGNWPGSATSHSDLVSGEVSGRPLAWMDGGVWATGDCFGLNCSRDWP